MCACVCVCVCVCVWGGVVVFALAWLGEEQTKPDEAKAEADCIGDGGFAPAAVDEATVVGQERVQQTLEDGGKGTVKEMIQPCLIYMSSLW